MNPSDLYHVLLFSQYALGLITFISLLFISAPYGRFARGGWGPSVRAVYGWVIMESPAVLMITFWFLQSDFSTVAIIMLAIWQSHYLKRTFYYPFQMKGRTRPFPAVLVLMAILFNLMNGYINGFYVFQKAHYEITWLYTWQFWLGIVVFYIGYVINTWSDRSLSGLVKTPDDKYSIPHGGLFNYVSSPHYFGEIIEWIGWAILTWSWAGLAFACYTFANLAPRALSHHKWYRNQFSEYPKNRKALIPYLW